MENGKRGEMPDCTYSSDCFFYKEGYRHHPTGRFLREDFCYKGPSFCAINIAFNALGEEEMPPDLLPQETDRIKQFLI
jgi:hypothetical protein